MRKARPLVIPKTICSELLLETDPNNFLLYIEDSVVKTHPISAITVPKIKLDSYMLVVLAA